VTLKVVIGESGDAELAEFIEAWAKKHPTDPRRDQAASSTTGTAA
jgi:hypothetical protein